MEVKEIVCIVPTDTQMMIMMIVASRSHFIRVGELYLELLFVRLHFSSLEYPLVLTVI